MKAISTHALEKLRDIFGEDIFANPQQFRAGLSDILGNPQDPIAKKVQNILKLAICDMKAYTRLKSAAGDDYTVLNLISEMVYDYAIDEDTAHTIINRIAWFLGYNRHTAELRADGTVFAEGCNADGQCDVEYWQYITAVSAGACHTVGLAKNGMVLATGAMDDEQCNIFEWENITAIATGTYHTLGLKADGTVIATGSNINGQCNVQSWSNIVKISAGSWYSTGVMADGTVLST